MVFAASTNVRQGGHLEIFPLAASLHNVKGQCHDSEAPFVEDV